MIPVEGDPGVASAYAAWNANPCVTDRANKVVNEITRLVVGIRNGALPGVSAHPALRNVVIIGGDDIIPMARLDDTTRLGNETGYADTFDVNGSYYGALSTSHFLSDDPFGDLDPIQWATRRLYVPELALGRLVESPAQIIAQLDAFGDAAGRLDAGRAYAAGYDFMTDGASAVREALSTSLTAANGAPATVTAPTNESTWTGAELLADLAGPPAPTIDAIFGHFDHTALETPGGDGVLADELATALPDGARLVFSMGCHSGLAVSDAIVGGGAVADDIAAALTARGAVYLAATGYGYGDQISVGLQERLMTLFAGELDGSVSLGDALRNAKQRYFASQGLYGAYDEKALSSTILYGLPMFAVGSERPVRPTPPNATTTPIPGTLGLSSVAYSEDFTFTSRSADAGRWFEADAGLGVQLPQITAGRPVQPRAETDVTAAGPDGSLLPAHGAVVTGLITGDVVADFDAAFSRPTLDNAAGEPEPVNGVAAFPTRLAGVTTSSDDRGPIGPDGIAQRQQLVLIPGQFLSSPDDGPGLGTQVLFDQMSGDVYYSPSDDWTAPKVGEVALNRTAGDTTAVVSVRRVRRVRHTSRHCALPGRCRLAVRRSRRRCGRVRRCAAGSRQRRQRADPGRRPGGRRRRQCGVGIEQGPRVRSDTSPSSAAAGDGLTGGPDLGLVRGGPVDHGAGDVVGDVRRVDRRWTASAVRRTLHAGRPLRWSARRRGARFRRQQRVRDGSRRHHTARGRHQPVAGREQRRMAQRPR